MHPVVVAVTERIIERSRDSRQQYLQLMQEYLRADNQRSQLGCTNLAHNYAAAGDDEKTILSHSISPMESKILQRPIILFL